MILILLYCNVFIIKYLIWNNNNEQIGESRNLIYEKFELVK